MFLFNYSPSWKAAARGSVFFVVYYLKFDKIQIFTYELAANGTQKGSCPYPAPGHLRWFQGRGAVPGAHPGALLGALLVALPGGSSLGLFL